MWKLLAREFPKRSCDPTAVPQRRQVQKHVIGETLRGWDGQLIKQGRRRLKHSPWIEHKSRSGSRTSSPQTLSGTHRSSGRNCSNDPRRETRSHIYHPDPLPRRTPSSEGSQVSAAPFCAGESLQQLNLLPWSTATHRSLSTQTPLNPRRALSSPCQGLHASVWMFPWCHSLPFTHKAF